MNKLNSRARIQKRIEEEAEKSGVKMPRGFRRVKYVDPMTGLVFTGCKTYAENKQMFHNALTAVCRGEYPNIFEAHKAFVG